MRYFGLARNAVLVSLAGLILLGAAAAPAGAADPITADVDSCCSFSPTHYTQNQGETAVFSDPVGAGMHNVTSVDNGPDGKVLFRSATLSPGQTAPVKGTRYLKAGTYKFFCTIHGPTMSGELTVTRSGTPVPRPSVKVKVLKQSLKRVVRTRRLKVKLRAGNVAARGVKLVATKGKRTLGRKTGLKLGARAKSTVAVKLTAAGVRSIKRRKKVLLKVKASVRHGKSVSGKRRLH